MLQIKTACPGTGGTLLLSPPRCAESLPPKLGGWGGQVEATVGGTNYSASVGSGDKQPTLHKQVLQAQAPSSIAHLCASAVSVLSNLQTGALVRLPVAALLSLVGGSGDSCSVVPFPSANFIRHPCGVFIRTCGGVQHGFYSRLFNPDAFRHMDERAS